MLEYTGCRIIIGYGCPDIPEYYEDYNIYTEIERFRIF